MIKKTLILKTYLCGFIKFLKITILFDKQIIQIEGIINKLQTFGELMAKKFKSTWLIRATKAIKSDIEYNFNIYDMITKNLAIKFSFGLLTTIEILRKITFKNYKLKVGLNYLNTTVRGNFLTYTTIFLILYNLLKIQFKQIGANNAIKRLRQKSNWTNSRDIN